jgi:GNAT superfamily N-acetyltransferase
VKITPLRQDMTPEIIDLLGQGAPYVWPRTASDYWLYVNLFSSTCPVALDGEPIAGVVIGFRSQDDPADIYLQDVMAHPDYRRQDIAATLIDAVRSQGQVWGCARLYLTSEPDNTAAHRTWGTLGFTNIRGDKVIDGVNVITDYKGPGKTRAVYELPLR